MAVVSFADFSYVHDCDFDTELEEADTTKILATLLTFSQCKDGIAESTAAVKLSNFLIQVEEKLLQLFGHVKGIDRTRILDDF